jgi:hypothetical protein
MQPESGWKPMNQDKAGHAEHQQRADMMNNRVKIKRSAEIRYTNMEMYQIGTLCRYTKRRGGVLSDRPIRS